LGGAGKSAFTSLQRIADCSPLHSYDPKGSIMSRSPRSSPALKNQFRKTPLHLKPLCLALSLALSPLMFPGASFAAPVVGSGGVTSGAATIVQTGNVTNVNQTTNKASINWWSFGTTPSETVNFNQPNASSVTLNRVIGNERSVLQGALNANGKVFLINSAGVLIGKGASINTAGFLASTLNITDDDFNAGRYVFKANGGSGSVINMGTITANDGGYVALLGNTVSNQGVISATKGTVALNAGNQITLNFNGDSLLSVTIDEGALNALVENRQAIYADGGQVIMTAKAADDLLGAQVNNTGVVQARTIDDLKGHIEMNALGGTTNVAGTLDASAPVSGDGGFIETSGDKVKVAEGTIITTKSLGGKTGNWLIDPNDFTIAASGGDMTAADVVADLSTTNFEIQTATMGTPGSGDINVNDAISWSGGNTLTLTAERNININSAINAVNGGLTLNAGNMISAPAAVNVGTFTLNSGTWSQIGALPAFSATDFRIASGTFIRAAGGDGSVGNPYQIADVYGLQGMGSDGMLGNSYELIEDIDASGTALWNSGAGFNPVGNPNVVFTGTFDGQNHTIGNLTINRPLTEYIGLFGYATGASIANVVVANAHIVGQDYVGALLGSGDSALNITNVGSSGTVAGATALGGLIGQIVDYDPLLDSNGVYAIISNSYSDATVTSSTSGGTIDAGGLVGYMVDTRISNSHATGAVNLTGNNVSQAGGLVGFMWNGSIDNSYATGAVTANDLNSSQIGGLLGFVKDTDFIDGFPVGSVNVTISNSYATGAVIGGYQVGGLIGIINTSSAPSGDAGVIDVIGSHADGAVTGLNVNGSNDFGVGGLVGTIFGGYATIDNSYATGNVIAVKGDAGGLVGFIKSPQYRVDPTTGLPVFTISNSYATGSVSNAASAFGGGTIGGLVGQNAGTIDGSHATGDVTLISATGTATADIAGGLVGVNSGAITNSQASGNVSGTRAIGGLVGYNTGLIDHSQASGNVNGVVTGRRNDGAFGGLVGTNYGGTIRNSIASGIVTGDQTAGGLVGLNVNGGLIDNSYWNGASLGGRGIGQDTWGFGPDNGTMTNSFALFGDQQLADAQFYVDGTIDDVLAARQAAADAAAQAAADAAAQAEADAAAAQAAADAATAQQAQVADAGHRSGSVVNAVENTPVNVAPPSAINPTASIDNNIVFADSSNFSADVKSITVDGVRFDLDDTGAVKPNGDDSNASGK
jgi:filamentous hemagglutinin family protein